MFGRGFLDNGYDFIKVNDYRINKKEILYYKDVKSRDGLEIVFEMKNGGKINIPFNNEEELKHALIMLDHILGCGFTPGDGGYPKNGNFPDGYPLPDLNMNIRPRYKTPGFEHYSKFGAKNHNEDSRSSYHGNNPRGDSNGH